MAYDSKTGLWTPDDPNGSQTGSSAAGAASSGAAGSASGGGLLNPGGSTNTSSVSTNVNNLTADNSTYMQQAKAAGADYANSRGVQNTSIGAQASQKAAYDAALPIATADATNITQKDLSAQGFAQNQVLQTQQIASTEKIAQLSADTQTDIAKLNIDAAAKQQAAQILSNEKIAGDQEATQKAIAQMNIDDADKQQLLSIAANQRIADTQQSTQLQIANMNVTSNQQDKAQAAATTYANIYASMVNAINQNTSIPADARQAYLDNAKTMYNNGMGLIEQTYNVSLDWGQTPTGAGASGGYAPASSSNTATSTTNNYAQPGTATNDAGDASGLGGPTPAQYASYPPGVPYVVNGMTYTNNGNGTRSDVRGNVTAL